MFGVDSRVVLRSDTRLTVRMPDDRTALLRPNAVAPNGVYYFIFLNTANQVGFLAEEVQLLKQVDVTDKLQVQV